MNAIEIITRIVTARQGDAIGSQVRNIYDGSLDEANPNALAYILAELENLQAVDWEEVAQAVEDLADVLEAAGMSHDIKGAPEMADRDTLQTLAAVLALAMCWLLAGIAALPVLVDAWNMPDYRHAEDVGQPRGIVIQQGERRSLVMR